MKPCKDIFTDVPKGCVNRYLNYLINYEFIDESIHTRIYNETNIGALRWDMSIVIQHELKESGWRDWYRRFNYETS